MAMEAGLRAHGHFLHGKICAIIPEFRTLPFGAFGFG
jgi:hypothetical protein